MSMCYMLYVLPEYVLHEYVYEYKYNNKLNKIFFCFQMGWLS